MTSRTAPLTALTALTACAALAAGSLLVATGPSYGADVLRPALETRAHYDDAAGGDADADDPAIWVHPGRVGRSVVLGTLKNGGLDAYDLDGRLLQHVDTPAAPGADLEAGRFNNVDLVPGGGRFGDLAVVTDRGRDRLRFYRVSARGAAADADVLTDVTAASVPRLFSPTEAAVEEQRTGYGLAVRQSGRATYAVASRRSTSTLGMFRLVRAGAEVSYRRTARLRLPDTFTLRDGSNWSPCTDPGDGPQVEGMVVDQTRDVLYAAQEDVGVWRIPLDGAGFGRPTLIEKVREFGRQAAYDDETEECVVSGGAVADSGRHLTADAEGLTLVERDGRPVQLLASSQGDSTFAVFGLRGRFVRSFAIRGRGGVAGVDGDQHSDGAALVTTPMGPRFPRGLLVVQDGENTPGVVADGETRPNSNFKFVPWR